jgi:hypothetical protein
VEKLIAEYHKDVPLCYLKSQKEFNSEFNKSTQSNNNEINSGLFSLCNFDDFTRHLSIYDINMNFSNELNKSFLDESLLDKSVMSSISRSKVIDGHFGVDNKPKNPDNIANINAIISFMNEYAKHDISSTAFGMPSPSNMAWLARIIFNLIPKNKTHHNKNVIFVNELVKQASDVEITLDKKFISAVSDTEYTRSNFKEIIESGYSHAYQQKDLGTIIKIRNEMKLLLSTLLQNPKISLSINTDLQNLFNTMWGASGHKWNEDNLTNHIKRIKSEYLTMMSTSSTIFDKNERDEPKATFDTINFENIIAHNIKNLDPEKLFADENFLRSVVDNATTIMLWVCDVDITNNFAYQGSSLNESTITHKSLERSLQIFITIYTKYLDELSVINKTKITKNMLILSDYINKLYAAISNNSMVANDSIVAAHISIPDNPEINQKPLQLRSRTKETLDSNMSKVLKFSEFIQEAENTYKEKYSKISLGRFEKLKGLFAKHILQSDFYDDIFELLQRYTQHILLFPEKNTELKLEKNKSVQVACMLAVFIIQTSTKSDPSIKSYHEKLRELIPEGSLLLSLENSNRLIKIFSITGEILKIAINEPDGQDGFWSKFIHDKMYIDMEEHSLDFRKTVTLVNHMRIHLQNDNHQDNSKSYKEIMILLGINKINKSLTINKGLANLATENQINLNNITIRSIRPNTSTGKLQLTTPILSAYKPVGDTVSNGNCGLQAVMVAVNNGVLSHDLIEARKKMVQINNAHFNISLFSSIKRDELLDSDLSQIANSYKDIFHKSGYLKTFILKEIQNEILSSGNTSDETLNNLKSKQNEIENLSDEGLINSLDTCKTILPYYNKFGIAANSMILDDRNNNNVINSNETTRSALFSDSEQNVKIYNDNATVDRNWLNRDAVVSYMLYYGYSLECTDNTTYSDGTLLTFASLENPSTKRYIMNNAIGTQSQNIPSGMHWTCVTPVV